MSKILVDLDGCLANTPRMISKWAKELYNIGPGDVPYQETVFNIEDVWEGMNFHKLKKIFDNPEFWKTIRPFNMVANFTKQLCRWGEVHIITDRRWYPELVEETRAWLVNNSIPYTTLAVIKGKEKYKYCEDNGILVAIEDRPENAESLSKVCPTIVMRWPYNENEVVGISNVVLADNYYQATKLTANILNMGLDNWVVAQSTEVLSSQ